MLLSRAELILTRTNMNKLNEIASHYPIAARHIGSRCVKCGRIIFTREVKIFGDDYICKECREDAGF